MNCPHCNNDLATHPDTRCLDAVIAGIMGWTEIRVLRSLIRNAVEHWRGIDPDRNNPRSIPDYSDPAEAWNLEGWLLKQCSFRLGISNIKNFHEGMAFIQIPYPPKESGPFYVYAETRELALKRACAVVGLTQGDKK